MPEKEPGYFKDFREHMDQRFDVVDQKFVSMDKKFEGIIEGLAISTANGFRDMEFRFDGIENDIFGIKESMEKIEAHIGRYEIRAQNIEGILSEDVKPRISELEKAFLAI